MDPTDSTRADDSSDARQLVLDRVDTLCAAYAATAVARDRAGGTAKTERDLIRELGLLGVVVPRALGGFGWQWPETLAIVRRVARVDSSLAHLLGFHYLMLATIRLFGTEAQWTRHAAETVRGRLFWGNALNPLDQRTTCVSVDGGVRVNGTKSFCSGARDSDMMIVSARPEGESRLLIAAVATSSPGIRVLDDWDAIGQRQTDSGTVEIENLFVAQDQILDTPGPLATPFASLRPCLAQLVLANVYLGLAEGALDEARRYTTQQARAWFASGVERPTDDPYILAHYGTMQVELAGARALADLAGAELQKAWARGGALTAAERGDVAVAVALAKVATTRTGLDVTTRMFDVMGARAASGKAGVDRFWRNLRTHTLHDPVDYKLRDLGRWTLTGEPPIPSFYS